MKLPHLLLSVSTCLFLTAAKAQQQDTQLLTKFENLIRAYEKNNYHGVILIAKADSIYFERAYGYANVEKRVPNTITTKFKTESVGKMFTAAAIQQLVDAGKLTLTTTVREILPGLLLKHDSLITVHHLLSHTSGMMDMWDHPDFQWNKKYTQPDWDRFLKETPFSFDTPGNKSRYSTAGYEVLGRMIEALSKQPFDDYVKQNLFAKASMNDTWHMQGDTMPERDAQPYRWISSRQYIKLNQQLANRASAGGGWVSTVRDLHAFVSHLVTGKLISESALQRMQTGYTNDTLKVAPQAKFAYGLERWMGTPIKDKLIYGHNGGGAGYSIDAFYEPESGYVVISCMNMYRTSRQVAANFFRILFDQPLQPVEKPKIMQTIDYLDTKGLSSFVNRPASLFDSLAIQPDLFYFESVQENLLLGGRCGDASEWTKVAIQYFPASAWMWVLKGDALLACAQKWEARVAYEQAVEKSRQTNDAYWGDKARARLANL